MFAFERHWALCTLEGFAPDGPKGLAPRGERIEWMAAWDLMNGAGTSKGRLGTRLALWFIAFAPIWMFYSFHTIAGLPKERRAVVLDRMLTSKIWLFRELTLLVKLVASMALLGNAKMRAASGYDAEPNGIGINVPDEFLPAPPRRKLPMFADVAAKPARKDAEPDSGLRTRAAAGELREVAS